MNSNPSDALNNKDIAKLSKRRRRWKNKTLVVGPRRPVDGDSQACTKAIIEHLRAQSKEAYTLPTIEMFPQLKWIITHDDIHPACLKLCNDDLTVGNLQLTFDALCQQWQPDEIVLVDGQRDRLGFDAKGVPVYTIDHHLQNGARNDKEAFIQAAPATGCLLIRDFGIRQPILTVAILTDTFWLRQNMPAEAIVSLFLLHKRGRLTNSLLMEYQQKLMVPKNPEVLMALRSCELCVDDKAVLAVLNEASPEIHRGVVGDLGYYFRHLCIVRSDGYVSVRTADENADLREIDTIRKYRGGGHRQMAGVQLPAPVDMSLIKQLWAEFLEKVNEGDDHV